MGSREYYINKMDFCLQNCYIHCKSIARTFPVMWKVFGYSYYPMTAMVSLAIIFFFRVHYPRRRYLPWLAKPLWLILTNLALHFTYRFTSCNVLSKGFCPWLTLWSFFIDLTHHVFSPKPISVIACPVNRSCHLTVVLYNSLLMSACSVPLWFVTLPFHDIFP